MNAMLDPRIVAASTHFRDFSAHGASASPERTMASLLTGFIATRMRVDCEWIPARFPGASGFAVFEACDSTDSTPLVILSGAARSRIRVPTKPGFGLMGWECDRAAESKGPLPHNYLPSEHRCPVLE